MSVRARGVTLTPELLKRALAHMEDHQIGFNQLAKAAIAEYLDRHEGITDTPTTGDWWNDEPTEEDIFALQMGKPTGKTQQAQKDNMKA